MDHLNQNLALLQKHHNQAYSAMLAFYTANQTEPTPVELKPFDHSEEMNLVYTLKGEPQRRLYAQEPSKYWNDCVKHSKNLANCKILFVFGIGLGSHLKQLIEEHGAHVDHYVFIENQPIVAAHAFKLHDFSSVLTSDKSTFIIAPGRANCTKLIKAFFLDRNRLLQCQKIGFFYHLPSLTHDGPFYVEFTQAIDSTLSNLQEIFRAPAEDNIAALRNLVANAKTHSKTPYLSDCRNSLSGKPALIVGAGPSLDALVPTLKAVHNKIFIFATDAAVPVLVENNIHPDFIICAERVLQQAMFFDRLPNDLSAKLITLPTVHPKVLGNFRGQTYFVPRLGTYGAWLHPQCSEDLGLGVSTVAFQITQILGCHPVYLVGQNFAYSRNAEHAYATSKHDYINNIKKFHSSADAFEVPGNSNLPIKTHKDWNAFRKELSAHILQSGCTVYNVIDAAEGARIEHCEILDPMGFRSIMEKHQLKSKWQPEMKRILGDISPLIRSTAEYLTTLHTACQKAMKTLHADFFETINGEINPDVFAKTRNDWIKRWNGIQEELIDLDREKFYFFTNLTFVAQNLMLLIDRENLDLSTLSPYNYLFKYCFKTIEWIQSLDGWTIRLREILTNSQDP